MIKKIVYTIRGDYYKKISGNLFEIMFNSFSKLYEISSNKENIFTDINIIIYVNYLNEKEPTPIEEIINNNDNTIIQLTKNILSSVSDMLNSTSNTFYIYNIQINLSEYKNNLEEYSKKLQSYTKFIKEMIEYLKKENIEDKSTIIDYGEIPIIEI